MLYFNKNVRAVVNVIIALTFKCKKLLSFPFLNDIFARLQKKPEINIVTNAK